LLMLATFAVVLRLPDLTPPAANHE
jgi:hypothetical protein